MKIGVTGLLVVFASTLNAQSLPEADQPKVWMDEEQWIAFYDVPSRRFRDIRIAFVTGKLDQAASDLDASANYIAIESLRAAPEIGKRLTEVADRLMWIAENIDDASVTIRDLDATFARAHWLLSQHYLVKARASRANQHHRNAGLYLWAMTHHLERAVLWSNSRIDREIQKTLEDLRALADQLQAKDRVKEAYAERPLQRADKLLRTLGKVIDRPVVLPAE